MRYLLKRTAAYLIDCSLAFAAVMLLIQGAILSPLRESVGITDTWLTSSINLQLYVLLTISLPVWLYFTYLDSRKSKGTIGKRILRLSVTDDQTKRLPLGTSFGRTILKLLPWEIAHIGVIFPTPLYFSQEPGLRGLTLFGIALFVVYIISIPIHSGRRSIYDSILGTQVVER